MKSNVELSKKTKEGGITLVALVITIIVLVILAAVSIKTIYDSKIVEYAINGAKNYQSKAEQENAILHNSTNLMENYIIGGMYDFGSTDIPNKPTDSENNTSGGSGNTQQELEGYMKIPEDTIEITENNKEYNVTNYAIANVNIPTNIVEEGSFTVTYGGTWQYYTVDFENTFSEPPVVYYKYPATAVGGFVSVGSITNSSATFGYNGADYSGKTCTISYIVVGS